MRFFLFYSLFWLSPFLITIPKERTRCRCISYTRKHNNSPRSSRDTPVVRGAVEAMRGKFVRKHKFFPRITLHEAIAKRRFALPADIYVRGIEIIESFRQIIIDHAGKFFVILLLALHRQTHAAESEILFHSFKVLHSQSLRFFLFRQTLPRHAVTDKA